MNYQEECNKNIIKGRQLAYRFLDTNPELEDIKNTYQTTCDIYKSLKEQGLKDTPSAIWFYEIANVLFQYQEEAEMSNNEPRLDQRTIQEAMLKCDYKPEAGEWNLYFEPIADEHIPSRFKSTGGIVLDAYVEEEE